MAVSKNTMIEDWMNFLSAVHCPTPFHHSACFMFNLFIYARFYITRCRAALQMAGPSQIVRPNTVWVGTFWDFSTCCFLRCVKKVYETWLEVAWLQETCLGTPSLLQKTSFSLESRLALASVGCQHAENGPIHMEMDVDCVLVITSKVKPFSRPDKTRKEEWMVKPVFCIVDTGSCYTICWFS